MKQVFPREDFRLSISRILTNPSIIEFNHKSGRSSTRTRGPAPESTRNNYLQRGLNVSVDTNSHRSKMATKTRLAKFLTVSKLSIPVSNVEEPDKYTFIEDIRILGTPTIRRKPPQVQLAASLVHPGFKFKKTKLKKKKSCFM